MRRPAALVLAVACLAGCGEEEDGVSVIPEGSLDYALPGETVAEWVEHGDQLSLISVIRESEPEAWPEYRNSGGLVGRNVTAVVERTRSSRAIATSPCSSASAANGAAARQRRHDALARRPRDKRGL